MSTVDRVTDAGDLVRLAFRAAQIDGREPFVRSTTIDYPVAPTSLLPDDAVIERSVTTDTNVVALARSPRGTLLISVSPRSASVSVSASTDEMAGAIVGDVLACAPTRVDPGTVPIRTWHLAGRERPVGTDRRVGAPEWSEIARNYPAAVRDQIEALLGLERPARTGKLILWHGAPGTGKTTALRSLLRAWAPWCAGQYISDPERFFEDPGYIGEVLTRSAAPRHGPTLTHAGEPDALWRILVAEDADEYLRASARRDAGAGLGRLLNLADGILGQGYNTLILLTTNEELYRLHPALIRPGRCLARVEFTSFRPSEGTWLPDGIVGLDTDATLAELFERCGALQRLGSRDASVERSGVYL